MKRFFALVKLLLVQQYRIKPTSEKKKRGGTIALFIVLGVCFLPMVISIVAGTYTLGKVAGADRDICTLLLTVCQGLVLIFGTMSVLTNVFNSKDADKLLFLPISPTVVFLAKLTVVYITEAVTTAVVILIALLPFGIGAGASALYFVMIIFAFLFVPILPLFLGTFLAMPLSALLAKIKNNGIAKTVVQILFFIAVMVMYMLLMTGVNSQLGGMEGEEENLEAVLLPLIEKLRASGGKLAFIHPNFMLATAMTVTTFGSFCLVFLMTLLENAALLGLVLLASLPFYRWILTASLETSATKRKQNADLQVKNQGVLKELIITDLKRVVRNSQLGFQAFAGIIVMPIIVVVFYFLLSGNAGDEGNFFVSVGNSSVYQIVAPIVILAYMYLLGVASNMLGLFPISRENKALAILKSLPVSFEKILLAKVVLATVVMAIADMLTCLFAVLFFGLKWYFGIAMVIVMTLIGFGGMCITTLLDLKSPHLGWTNYNQSLKNSKNSWMAMLIGLLVAVAMAVVCVPFVLWFSVASQWIAVVLMWIVLIGISATYAIVAHKIMNSKAAQYFERIEV